MQLSAVKLRFDQAILIMKGEEIFKTTQKLCYVKSLIGITWIKLRPDKFIDIWLVDGLVLVVDLKVRLVIDKH